MMQKPIRQRYLTAFLFLLSFVTLTGCSVLMESGMQKRAANTMAHSSYAAADMLIQQSRNFISQDTPLAIGPLTDLDHPNEHTNFGQMLAQQIASRFVQLGFNVIADDNMATLIPEHGMVPPNPGGPTSIVTPPEQRYNAHPSGTALITGRYAIARDAVLVNLRIIEGPSQKVLASYDYSVPKTPDIRELAKTQHDKDSFFDF